MVHELNLQRPKGVPKDDPIGYPLGAGLYVDRLPAGGALGADARGKVLGAFAKKREHSEDRGWSEREFEFVWEMA
ncbi:hypothetical protein KJZ99_06460 [bacterium]|nr:hypothetical protein [bacterium]